MKKRFFCPGYGETANGMSVVADLIDKEGVYKDYFVLHGAWSIKLWLIGAILVIQGKKFVRMPHGSYSPVAMMLKGRKKKLFVKPIERWLLRRAEKVIVTCAAERDWVLSYEPKVAVEELDLMRYFEVNEVMPPRHQGALRVLYLGRRHPLKCVHLLEFAIKNLSSTYDIELKVATNVKGKEKEALFEWCDVLCLPTLTENFGLAVAEARQQGKLAITTDGAPRWENESGVVYLKGFVKKSDAGRIAMLEKTLKDILNKRNSR